MITARRPRRPILRAAALALPLGAAPAQALEVTRSIDIAAPPAKVWQTIGDFCGIGDWHPVIEKCALSDKDGIKMRALDLKGGGVVKEEQLSRDDKVMKYSYGIVDGPLPVSDYRSTLAVAPEGTGSKVTWTGAFNAKGAPDETAMAVIAGIYDPGLKALAEKVK